MEWQISTLYECLLASRDNKSVMAGAQKLLKPLSAEKIIKATYVLDFLDLKNYPDLREADLEQ